MGLAPIAPVLPPLTNFKYELRTQNYLLTKSTETILKMSKHIDYTVVQYKHTQ